MATNGIKSDELEPGFVKPLIMNDIGSKNQIISTKSGVFHQILVTCAILLCATACGMPIGYSAILLPQLYNSSSDLNIDVEMGSWIASIHSLATPFGSFASGPIADHFGRKPVLIFSVLPLVSGWLCIGFAQSHLMILIGRILAGLAVGLTGPPAQIYLAEIAEPNIRGLLIGVPFVFYSFGILIVYILGTSFHWRIVAFSSILIPILAIISLILIPETPIWLIHHSKFQLAQKSLIWLRGNDLIGKYEFNQLYNHYETEQQNQHNQNQHNINQKSNNFFYNLFKKSTLKPLLIINIFNILIIFSGTYLIVFYAIDIISEIDTTINTYYSAIYTAIVRMLCTLIYCFLLLKIKRRLIIIMSGLGSAISCLILGIYMLYIEYINQNTSASDMITKNTYFIFILIIIYIAFNTGFLIMPGIMIGELLPVQIRGQIAGYIFAIFHILTFGITKIFPIITYNIHIYGLFIMFGISSLIASIIMFLILPETKNQTLIQIENYFCENNWFWFTRPTHPKKLILKNSSNLQNTT